MMAGQWIKTMKKRILFFILGSLYSTNGLAQFSFRVDAFLFDPGKKEASAEKGLKDTTYGVNEISIVDELRGFFNNPVNFDQSSPLRIVVEARYTQGEYINYPNIPKGHRTIPMRFRFTSSDGRIDFKTKVVASGPYDKVFRDWGTPYVKDAASANVPVVVADMIAKKFMPYLRGALNNPVKRSRDQEIAYLINAQSIQKHQVQTQMDRYNKIIAKVDRIKKQRTRGSKFFGSIAKSLLSAAAGNIAGSFTNGVTGNLTKGLGGGLAGVGGKLIKPESTTGKVAEILSESYKVAQHFPNAKKTVATSVPANSAYGTAETAFTPPAPSSKQYEHRGYRNLDGEYWWNSTKKQINKDGNKVMTLKRNGTGDFLFKKGNKRIPFKWGASLKDGRSVTRSDGDCHLVGACTLVTLDTGRTKEMFCINSTKGRGRMALGLFDKKK